MLVEKRVLTGMGVKPETADRYVGRLNEVLPKHGIDTPLRVAHFLAQVVMESARMEAVVENMNYSAGRLLQVFGSRFTEVEAEQFAHKPEKIGNRVYANRLGNGNEASGDGFRYRGRGLIQLTGRGHYVQLRDFLAAQDPGAPDVVTQPGLVASRYAVDSAVFFWTQRRINELADADDVTAVTKAVNGATHGLDARRALLDKAKALLGAAVPELAPLTHTVTASQLNLRAGPTTSAEIHARLDRGAGVQRIAAPPTTADGFTWFRVRAAAGGVITIGFVAAEFLEPAATLEVVTHLVDVKTFLSFRDAPSLAGALIAELQAGTGVHVKPEPTVSADGHEWVEARAVVEGRPTNGFLASGFLEPAGGR